MQYELFKLECPSSPHFGSAHLVTVFAPPPAGEADLTVQFKWGKLSSQFIQTLNKTTSYEFKIYPHLGHSSCPEVIMYLDEGPTVLPSYGHRGRSRGGIFFKKGGKGGGDLDPLDLPLDMKATNSLIWTYDYYCPLYLTSLKST